MKFLGIQMLLHEKSEIKSYSKQPQVDDLAFLKLQNPKSHLAVSPFTEIIILSNGLKLLLIYSVQFQQL